MNMFCKTYALGQTESGYSDNGEWYRRTLVCETIDEKQKLIAFDVFGQKRCDKLEELKPGMMLRVWFTIEAREHDGKWYNRVNLDRYEAWSAEKGGE